ncbi:adenosylcobinamide-GDP ribazoletransferase [Streptomyces sp. VRA16 Mangrove soil]|uniref:adenosylcobinamide-GDP ribazoletransferase n=1 Tax=Streptomyces sp. VRA16 Mangrove soil TaxID=2817434 RepID=UPI001A9E978B|nr:adenosylcobinamide-GDP ribazoletransferase [Streptomyces sp. VRA16 Mangrove soil]MBO1333313.1 adenosylcobinamide-GDP ribazoletransferase [Streptomyces sp. VRA16 Mangrove soil]
MPATNSRASLADGIRFAFGTLTVLPVTVSRWDRDAARAGMLCAPLAGLVVGLAAAALGGALSFLGAGALLCAVASVAVPAALTRGLHLDGLADVADGLGSGKPAEDALRIMKQSDIGPFGVVTLVLALLAQVAVLAQLYADSWTRGAVAAALCGITSRLALTFASRTGVPAARPEGLGAAVAETVPVRRALAAGVLLVAAAAALSVQSALAVVLACGAGELMLRRCVTRFGGVTGDVFGAVAEVTGTAALVVLALG